jgi:hypothetical protein
VPDDAAHSGLPHWGYPARRKDLHVGRGWETHATLGSSKWGGVADSLATCQTCTLDRIAVSQRLTRQTARARRDQPTTKPMHRPLLQ